MILEPEQRRVLTYITAANRGGHRPAPADVEQWRRNPTPKPGQRGPLIEAARPGRLAPAAPQMAKVLGSSLKSLFGSPAKYGPSGPPEPYIDHLVRLGWAVLDESNRLSVTALAKALMLADDQDNSGRSDSAVVLLGSDDPLAFGRVVAQVAESGRAMIVDPYLRAAELHTLLSNTDSRRFLVGPGLGAGDVAELRVLLAAHESAELIELRQAARGVLHDRYIIGDHSVYSVGSSLNSVGKSTTTVLTPLGDVAAEVRDKADQWWANATLVATSSPAVDAT